MSAARGALGLLAALPAAQRILGDRGCAAAGLREGLKGRELRLCIPARRGRRRPAGHSRRLDKQRHRSESACARRTGWRAIATRDSRRGELLPAALPPSPSGGGIRA
jgi:IS5 family transposase